MRIEAVLFDMDGTLIDTAPDFIAVSQAIREAHGLPSIDERRIRDVISGGAKAMVAAAFDMNPEDPELEPLRIEFLERYQTHCACATKPFPEIEALLEHLEATGIQWGVVTNKPLRFAEPIMQRLGLAERSAVLICPDHVSRSKPDPEPLQLACQRLQLPCETVLFVGDDLRDIESGRAAGTKTAAVTYGYIHPEDNPAYWGADAVVDRPLQLIELIDRASCCTH